MVMALAEVNAGRVRVIAVEMAGSKGIERGKVKDEEQASAAVGQLLEVFREKHGMNIDSLRVSLPATWLKRTTVKEVLNPSRGVKEAYLDELEKRCRMSLPDDGREPVATLPLSYTVDGKETRHLLNQPVEEGSACYVLYSARESEMEKTREWLSGLGITRVDFYAGIEAMSRAVASKRNGYQNFALVDLGADSTKVLVFQEGVVVRDVELPLGCSAIDGDIHTAFSQSLDVARQLKHEHGSAVSALEKKDRKIIIPNTQYSVTLRALLHIEQCRLEELLEGVIFQVQSSGFSRALPDGILLTGGGSQVKNVEILLNKLSGYQVRRAVITGVEAMDRSWLENPGYLTAFGLLACESKTRKSLGNLWKRWF